MIFFIFFLFSVWAQTKNNFTTTLFLKNLPGCLSVGNKNGIGRSAWIERKNVSQIGQLVEHIFSKFKMVKMSTCLGLRQWKFCGPIRLFFNENKHFLILVFHMSVMSLDEISVTHLDFHCLMFVRFDIYEKVCVYQVFYVFDHHHEVNLCTG